MTLWMILLLVWLAGIPAALVAVVELGRHLRMRRSFRALGDAAPAIQISLAARRRSTHLSRAADSD